MGLLSDTKERKKRSEAAKKGAETKRKKAEAKAEQTKHTLEVTERSNMPFAHANIQGRRLIQFDRESAAYLQDEEGVKFAELTVKEPVRAVHIGRPFVVKDDNGSLIVCEDGWLVLEPDGSVRPVSADLWDQQVIPD